MITTGLLFAKVCQSRTVTVPEPVLAQPVLVSVLIMALALLAAGAVVGAVHGAFLVTLAGRNLVER